MKFELRMFREDKQKWAYAEVEIDDALINRAPDKAAFMAQEIVPHIYTMIAPFIEAMQKLK